MQVLQITYMNDNKMNDNNYTGTFFSSKQAIKIILVALNGLGPRNCNDAL